MSDTRQPLADPLIGFEYKDVDGMTYRVTGFWDVNQAYAIVHNGHEELLRPTAVVRRRQQLDQTT